MNVALSEEQEMLKKASRDFLTERCTKKVVKELEGSVNGYSSELWQEMAELGWMGMAIPEKYGGGGMSFLDLAVLLEEMGRACLPGPFFSTVVLGALPILDLGSEEQKQRHLPKIAQGEAIFTLALTEPGFQNYDPPSIEVSAALEGGDYVIDGTKLFVADAHIADCLICVARTEGQAKDGDGITSFLVDAKDPGIKYTVLKTIANDKLCEVVFNKVRVNGDSMLGQQVHGWDEVQRVVERAALAKCCEMLGGLQMIVEMTIDYAKERKQFGRPIGSFQIIQHYCADIATDVEGARFSTYRAAWMLSEGMSCTREVAVAKAWIGEASQRVTALAHQVHGAIGVTIEHDLHYYTRRAKAGELAFGDSDFYREIVAREMESAS